MDTIFYNRTKNTSASRKSREENKNFVLQYPQHFGELIPLAFNISDAVSRKACWILECIANEKPEWFQPHLDFICDNLKIPKDDGVIDPFRKSASCLPLHISKKDGKISLSENLLHKITKACFDWLINDTKVACKVHAIRTLFFTGKELDWVSRTAL